MYWYLVWCNKVKRFKVWSGPQWALIAEGFPLNLFGPGLQAAFFVFQLKISKLCYLLWTQSYYSEYIYRSNQPIKIYTLESYGQNVFLLLSLCTIHSVRKSGLLPVFVTCVISRLHIKVSDQERIRLWLVPPILWANYDKLH